MSANYLAENDSLLEAGRILRGETRLIATEAHLKALQQLAARAYELFRDQRPEAAGINTEIVVFTAALNDWLREAQKVI